MFNRQHHRSGVILIIVAGISALLASLALTFLARMQSDTQGSQYLMREMQARIMLVAACNFIQERSRLGWDPVDRIKSYGTGGHVDAVEAFGWLDVRDGQPGPKNELGQFIGSLNKEDEWTDLSKPDRPAIRCPMYVMKRPPFAIMPTVARNPIITKPLLINPDPMPVIAPGKETSWKEYAYGDTDPDRMRTQASWFRVWRATATTFVVTCGGGDSHGFKNWDEVVAEKQTHLFGGDNDAGREYFAVLQSQENYLHYLVEWSAYTMNTISLGAPNSGDVQMTHWVQNATARQGNPVGTIRSIQRLLRAPDKW